jgi:hypothetical protein
MPVGKQHYVDLVDGEFRGTNADDLQAVFTALEASGQKDHLVVHFHGGLVGRAAAEGIAESLTPLYLKSKAYPLFFYWHSNALSVLAHNLDEVAKEPVFWRLVRRLALMLAGKLAEKPGGRGPTIQTESFKDVPDDPDELLEWTRQREPASRDDVADLPKSQQDQIEKAIKDDPVIKAESLAIGATLREPDEIEREQQTRARGGPAVRASRKTLMSPSVLKEIAKESPEPGTRGIGTLVAIAKYGVEISVAVITRYRGHRDHGLLPTIVEEVARTLYADSIGSTVWTLMKGDTHDAFKGGPLTHGGTAFIGQLLKWWKPGRRLTLVGHSTGAIYIGHLLEYADKGLPADARIDVVFLAPACTFEFLRERLPIFKRRVTKFRMFGLKDELERGYWEVPVLYPASLLYMVSGLFEDPVVDMPIVGMQRYFSGAAPYDDAATKEVMTWIDNRCVWSVADGGVGGLQSGALKHGGFDEDLTTRSSLQHILSTGF